MSYSFSVRGATRVEVLEKVAAELDKVVAAQPVHTADRVQAQLAAEAFLGVLPTPAADKDLYISVNGSVGWNGTLGAADQVLTSVNVGVSASLVDKQKA